MVKCLLQELVDSTAERIQGIASSGAAFSGWRWRPKLGWSRSRGREGVIHGALGWGGVGLGGYP